MDPIFDCVGDPRAMGHAQGLAFQEAIRIELEAAEIPSRRSRVPNLWALTTGQRLGRGAGRELIRHYTHLAERMAGIARRADVPLESLMELFCTATSPAEPSELLFAPAVAVALAGAPPPLLMRSLGGAARSRGEWVLRRSRPEVGFDSVEVTLPWLPSAIAGINEGGVAVAMVPRSDSYGSGVLAGAVNARHAPHAIVLVQECLQRFEDVAGCVDWCSKRPRAGNVSLLLADASGTLARVEVDGTACRVLDRGEALALDGAPHALRPQLEERLQGEPSLSSSTCASIAQAVGEQAVWLEPRARKLSLRPLREGSAGGEGEKAVEVSL